MSATFSAVRDEPRSCVRIVIELHDRDLIQNHLVPIDTNGPVEATAGYVLQCLQVIDRVRSHKYASIHADWFEQKRANLADANSKSPHNKGERAA